MPKDLGQATDPDTITRSGMYYMAANTPHAPGTSGYLLLHLDSGSRVAQIALINGSSSNYFVRTKPSGSGTVYSDWRKIVTDFDLPNSKAAFSLNAQDTFKVVSGGYVVRNGICTLTADIEVLIDNIKTGTVIASNIPIRDTYSNPTFSGIPDLAWGLSGTKKQLELWTNSKGELIALGGETGGKYSAAISYPVK